MYGQLVFSDADLMYVLTLIRGLLTTGLNIDQCRVTIGTCEITLPTSDIGMKLEFIFFKSTHFCTTHSASYRSPKD